MIKPSILGQLNHAINTLTEVDRTEWTQQEVLDLADKVKRYLQYDEVNRRFIIEDVFCMFRRILQTPSHQYQYIKHYVSKGPNGESIVFEDEIVRVIRNEDKSVQSFVGINWKTDPAIRHAIVQEMSDMQLSHILLDVNLQDVEAHYCD